MKMNEETTKYCVMFHIHGEEDECETYYSKTAAQARIDVLIQDIGRDEFEYIFLAIDMT